MASTTYSSLIPLDEWLTLKATNTTSFAEGKRKLVGLGWEDRRLGENHLGWDNNRLGEGLPAKLLDRYTQRHRDILNCHVSPCIAAIVGVDKEKLSEGQLRKLICAVESGAKVVNVKTADGIQLFVSVLSLGPNGVRGSFTERREKSDKTTAEPSLRGVEMEVTYIFWLIFTDCFNTHFKTIFPDARPCLWSGARVAQVQDELGDTLPEEQEEELGPAGAAGAIGQEEGAERGETGQEGADEVAAGVAA